MSVSGSEYSSEEEEFRDDMRVFLRLRPINKLEQSRRSKNCIELHEDPTLITVDSPLEGEYDFTFDHVFEEYATQEEVFEHAVADIPISILEGFNCTCIAYGQTGTGKTHTMLGAKWGAHGVMHKSSRLLKFDTPMSLSSPTGAAAGVANDEFARESGNSSGKFEVSSEKELGDSESEGMIYRTVSSLFALMKKVKPTTEFTIRVSYVEIYLEKILDLLNPQGSSGSITIEEDEEADKAAGSRVSVRIKGASELCCFDEADVCALLTRGNACRTMSSTEMNTESSRSHAVFVLRLEQRDMLTGRVKKSVLHMVDLAGSELGSKEANKRSSMAANVSAVHSEALMINKSLSALNKMIRAQLAHQDGEKDVPLDEIARQSKLSRLIRPAFGGNCLTTLILTASPSSYNIGETISSINFGQRCRRIYNEPVPNIEEETSEYYRKQIKETKTQYEDAMALVRALASECLRMKDGESTGIGPLWDTISYLGKKHDPPVSFKVSIVKHPSEQGKTGTEEVRIFADERVQLQDEVEGLKEEIDILSRQRLDVEGQLAELQSEVAVLRTQNENLTLDKKRNVEELVNAKNEVQALSLRKLEVEHNLRTSQFRENEAIVFLRQFRRFYRNVLKDKASHGAGSIAAITSEVTKKVPNAPDLSELYDIDRLLVESGLLEDYEVDSDRASNSYLPSKDALMRSASAAQRAAAAEAELAREDTEDDDDDDETFDTYCAHSISRVAGPLRLPGPDVPMAAKGEEQSMLGELKAEESEEEDGALAAGADAGAGTQHHDEKTYISNDAISIAHSIAPVQSTGVLVTRRQRMLKTPAGILTAMREKDVEKELLEMSERCIDLQMALNEEKAVVDALTNKSGGLGKKRLAQEANSLRQQVEKKTASLTAIAWKMNELNLINKTHNEKMANRELHVMYLEEQLVELQNSNRRLVIDCAENEKKLRDEIDSLHRVVGGMTVPLWQFGEKSVGDKPLASRIVITSAGGDRAQDFDAPPQRRSIGEQEPDMEFPTLPESSGPDVVLSRSSESDNSVDDDVFSPDVVFPDSGVQENAVENPKRPKRRPSDRLKMTVKKLNVLNALSQFGSSLAVQEESSKPMSESRNVGAIRSAGFVSEGLTSGNRSIAFNPSSVAVESRDIETQTDEEVITADSGAQTQEVQIFEVGIPVIIDQGEPECNDAIIQTDAVQINDSDAQVKLDLQIETCDVEAQTDDVHVFEVGVPVLLDQQPDRIDGEAQTDHIATSSASIQTDDARDSSSSKNDTEVDETMLPRNVEASDIPDYQVQIRHLDLHDSDEPLASPSRAIEPVQAGSPSHVLLKSKSPPGTGDEAPFDNASLQESDGSSGSDVDGDDAVSGNSREDVSDRIDTNDAALDFEFEPYQQPLESLAEPPDAGVKRGGIDQPIVAEALWNEENFIKKDAMAQFNENWHEEDLFDLEDSEQGSDTDGDDFSEEDSDDYAFDEEDTDDDDFNEEEAGGFNVRKEYDAAGDDTIWEQAFPPLDQAAKPPMEVADDGFRNEEAHESRNMGGDEAAEEAPTFPAFNFPFDNDFGAESSDESSNVETSDEPHSSRDVDMARRDSRMPEDGQARSDAVSAAVRSDEPISLQAVDMTHGVIYAGEGDEEASKTTFISGDRPSLVEDHSVPTRPAPNNPSPSSNVVLQRSVAPKSPISRFMPVGTTTRPDTSRFMNQNDAPKPASRAGRRFMLDDDLLSQNLSSRRNPTTPVLSSAHESFERLDEGEGYDELGLRWGLTDDEIAADAAVLKTPHDDNRKPESSAVAASSTIDEDSEEETPHSDNSVDGEERSLFDNDFDEWRSSHGPETRLSIGSAQGAGRARGLTERKLSEAENDQVADESQDAVHDDDFEKLMGETVAALAAANASLGLDGGEENFDDSGDYENGDHDYEVPISDIARAEKDSFRSARESRFAGQEGRQESTSDEPLSGATDVDPFTVTGGKSGEYKSPHFVPDLEEDVQPATPLHVAGSDGDGIGIGKEVIQSSGNRESHQEDETVTPIALSADSSRKKDSHSSGRRHDEKKKKSRRSSKSPSRRPPRPERVEDERRHKSKSSRRSNEADDGERRSRSHKRTSNDEGGILPLEYSRSSSRHLYGDSGGESRRNSSSRHNGNGEAGIEATRLSDSAEFEKEVRRRANASLADSGEFGSDSKSRRRSSRAHGGADDGRRHRSHREHRHKHSHGAAVDNEGGVAESERRHRSSRHSSGGEDVGDVGKLRRHKSSRHVGVSDDRGEGSGERRRHKSSTRASGGEDSTDAVRGEGRRRKSRPVEPDVDGAPPRRASQEAEPVEDVLLDVNSSEERKRHSSSHRRHRSSEVDLEAVREERDRRGDEERRRRKKTVGEDQPSSRRSSSRRVD